MWIFYHILSLGWLIYFISTSFLLHGHLLSWRMSTFLLAWNLGRSISLRSTSIHIHRSAGCACWAKPISGIQRTCAKTWKVTVTVQTWWTNQCCEEILKHYICIDYRWYYRSYIYHILYNHIIYNTMKTLNTYSGTAQPPTAPFWSEMVSQEHGQVNCCKMVTDSPDVCQTTGK